MGYQMVKYSLLKLFNEMRADPVEICPMDNARVDKSIICTRTDFEYEVPSYAEMAREMGQWIAAYSQRYPRYQIR